MRARRIRLWWLLARFFAYATLMGVKTVVFGVRFDDAHPDVLRMRDYVGAAAAYEYMLALEAPDADE